MKIIPIILLILPLIQTCPGDSRAARNPTKDLPPSIPPQVLRVLEYKCIICHSEPLASFGGLDMTRWVETIDGRPGFLHLDQQGRQLASRDSFWVILERLLTKDKLLHMPLGEVLRPEELGPTVEWLEEQIGEPR